MTANKIVSFIVLFLIISTSALSQYSISRLEPPFWWAGMKSDRLELMVSGPGISDLEPVISDSMVRIIQTTTLPNPSYVFIMLEFDENISPRDLKISFQRNGQTVINQDYRLLEREPGSADRIGFNSSDVIYLITPDRFANGDTANDQVPNYADNVDRSNPEARHGGDLSGVAGHLDYIADLGFTAVWLNPVLENNMPRTSYHGYATTDFYKVDPRFGSNEDYKELGSLMKEKDLKLIMDMIANHCGSEHWWVKDPPSEDWFNFGGQYVMTNHRRSTIQDPYSSPSDRKLFQDGWFVESMPDLNQKNPLLARYLIQNSIWWIEYAGLCGIRQDTYSYPDKDFMSRWSCAIMDEYPRFSIVGEEWSENPAIVAYWQKGKTSPDGYTSCLGSLMDFPMQKALVQGLTEGDVFYKDGLIKMYETLANDFLYAGPGNLVIFPDNHDMNRFFTQVNEDFDLFKMGIAYILTMRGIPQIYYGTEVLMTSPVERDDGRIRSDFPGGWPGDTASAFTGKGLTEQQSEAMEFLRKMLNWRRDKSCLHGGKLVHYAPDKGTYVYFRYDEKEKVMVILNKNDKEILLDGSRFTELTSPARRGRDILTGQSRTLDTIEVPPRTALVLEL